MLVYTQRDAKRFDGVPKPPNRIREFVERENREHRENVQKYQTALNERNKRVVVCFGVTCHMSRTVCKMVALYMIMCAEL